MPDSEKLSVTLTSEQAAALRAAVERGENRTTSDAIREAVSDWQQQRALREEDVERLRKFWDEGVASGSAGPVDMDALRQEARARLNAARKA